MSIFQFFVLGAIFVLGIIAGGLSNVTSGGAGVFTTFVLVRYDHLSIQQSVGTILAASTIIVLIGAVEFYRNKQVDKQLSLTVGLAGVLGAFLAARWASFLQSTLLEHAFGLFTLFVALYTIARLYMMHKRKQTSFFAPMSSPASPPSKLMSVQTSNIAHAPFNGAPGVAANGEEPEEISRLRGRDPLAIGVQIALGISIGIATGLFGVGGAGLTLVAFMLIFKLRTKMMLGTSLMASLFRYAGGSVGYLSTGLIDPLVFVILVAGGGIGSLLGARFLVKNKKATKDIYIRLIVVVMLLFITYEFLLK